MWQPSQSQPSDERQRWSLGAGGNVSSEGCGGQRELSGYSEHGQRGWSRVCVSAAESERGEEPSFCRPSDRLVYKPLPPSDWSHPPRSLRPPSPPPPPPPRWPRERRRTIACCCFPVCVNACVSCSYSHRYSWSVFEVAAHLYILCTKGKTLQRKIRGNIYF